MDFKRPLEQHRISDNEKSDQLPQSQPRQSPIEKQIQINKRYLVVTLVATVLVSLLAYVVLQQYNTSRKWDQATQHYQKAEYAKVAELIGGLPMPRDEERLSMYAQTMLATRDLDKALPAYESLQNKNPSPETQVRIGNIYNEQKKYDKAVDAYKKVIDTNNSYVQAHVNLATVYRLQNRPDDAIAAAKRAVEANPSSVVLHELYVSMLLEKQDSDEFKKAVEALRKLNPEDPLLRSLEQ